MITNKFLKKIDLVMIAEEVDKRGFEFKGNIPTICLAAFALFNATKSVELTWEYLDGKLGRIYPDNKSTEWRRPEVGQLEEILLGIKE